MKIFKYELTTSTKQFIEMPEGSIILSVQVQRNTPCIWATVNEMSPMTEREIRMYATGEPIDMTENHRHLSTIQMFEGSLVFHVFEIIQ